MQITVTGQQMDVTEPLRNYATEKMERIEKHFDHVTTTNIVLHTEKNRHLAEATIHATGTTIHANAEGDDMYAVLDSLIDKLDRQVIKHKEKLTDHRRSDGSLHKKSAV
ncbi:MAG: ribosome-associated translation inhibitor RaiA [Gammaproteobacteria bacterium]|nr:ribosome-associated translation inhibitor RaiA [Gammaproteobacteria bacterium]